MHFRRHSELEGRHAFLSPSKYHWVNYSEEKLDRVFSTAMTAQRGTELHAFAAEAIRLGVKLPANGKTLSQYVNDAIGYKMTPEQPLKYSDNAFGCADAVGFSDRRRKLRIHDLKNGLTASKITQLEVYAALFCLEYEFRPFDIDIELRIYQNDEVQAFEADPDVVFHIMDRIVTFDKRINLLREEAQS